MLDARLDGIDTKSLVGLPELGRATSYRVKQAVQQVKALVGHFGDEDFLAMVARAMGAERETLAKRFKTAAAVV